VPKTIIEIGNMQDAGDAGLQVSASFQQTAANAIAKAITEFLSGSA
jgi:N-acetylmuramoyl-L-alanine amidase